MNKLTKAQVKSIAKKKGNIKVWLCPSKCFPNPENPFNVAIEKEFSNHDILNNKFEDFLNTFSYYNCNNETGKTVHYYEIIGA